MASTFIVMGMHKSGTTLVSELLDASGISMREVSDDGSYDQGNYFERGATKEINKKLLAATGLNSLRAIKNWDGSARNNELNAKAQQILFDAAQRSEGDWGFKDPRNCLTYNFWASLVADHFVVCVYRNPENVRAHYTSRRMLTVSRGFRALRAWSIYNNSMLEAYGRQPADRRIIVNYEKLMASKNELHRLERFVGRKLVDCRRNSMQRSLCLPNSRLDREVRLVNSLCKLDPMTIKHKLDHALAQEAGFPPRTRGR